MSLKMATKKTLQDLNSWDEGICFEIKTTLKRSQIRDYYRNYHRNCYRKYYRNCQRKFNSDQQLGYSFEKVISCGYVVVGSIIIIRYYYWVNPKSGHQHPGCYLPNSLSHNYCTLIKVNNSLLMIWYNLYFPTAYRSSSSKPIKLSSIIRCSWLLLFQPFLRYTPYHHTSVFAFQNFDFLWLDLTNVSVWQVEEGKSN